MYGEAVALVEEYQHALSIANVGGIRDLNTVFDQLGLRSSPQVVANCIFSAFPPYMPSMRKCLPQAIRIGLNLKELRTVVLVEADRNSCKYAVFGLRCMMP